MKLKGSSALLLFFLPFLFTADAVGQASCSDQALLLTGPSEFRLLATDVSYGGQEDAPYTTRQAEDLRRGVMTKHTVYYDASGIGLGFNHGGLAAESLSNSSWRVYPMFGLALSAGWYKPEGNEADGGYPENIRGLFRVGNTLWMGSDGVGIITFDLKKKTWSRFDLKANPIPGHHMNLMRADQEYAFIGVGEFPGGGLYVYSMKKRRALRLRAVPTACVSSYGNNSGELVQIGLNHLSNVKDGFLPIDWSLVHFDVVTPINRKQAYRFEKHVSQRSKTIFTITKRQLARAFR